MYSSTTPYATERIPYLLFWSKSSTRKEYSLELFQTKRYSYYVSFSINLYILRRGKRKRYDSI